MTQDQKVTWFIDAQIAIKDTINGYPKQAVVAWLYVCVEWIDTDILPPSCAQTGHPPPHP